MFTKKVYSGKDMLKWTRFELYVFLILSILVVSVYEFFHAKWLQFPFTPIALVGTAVAFVIGFQNNAAYDRIWEARKIWGGIVNTSRTFGMKVQAMVTGEYADDNVSTQDLFAEIKRLTYRHIAWMTALRYAMRQKKPWETSHDEKTNKEWASKVQPPEWNGDLVNDLKSYLSDDEINSVMAKNNKQTAILYLQSAHLKELKEKGQLWEFSFLELENVLEELFTLQGKTERIKNFPYPRHFATLNHYFTWIFIFILPFGIVPQFAEIGMNIHEMNQAIGHFFVWLAVPFCTIVSWVFHTMERIGRTGENPFEGTANDVPISTISRGIEIDLRQNLGESLDTLPDQFPAYYDIQF